MGIRYHSQRGRKITTVPNAQKVAMMLETRTYVEAGAVCVTSSANHI